MRKLISALGAILIIHMIVLVSVLVFKDWNGSVHSSGKPSDGTVQATEDPTEEIVQPITTEADPETEVPTEAVESTGGYHGLWQEIELTEKELLDRGKVVYLTFDDGPGPYTEELLDILAKYNVKATFFVTAGSPAYLDVIARQKAEGHTVAIHCYSHDYKKLYASEKAYFDDLKKIDDIILEQTGERSKMVRFPGGSANSSSKFNPGVMDRLMDALEDKGYQFYDWNVLSGDAGETTETEQVIKNIIDGMTLKKVATVLQHDSQKFSIDAVEQVLIWGLENGYTFLPLSEESPAVHHTGR